LRWVPAASNAIILLANPPVRVHKATKREIGKEERMEERQDRGVE
jgi:hypothetical protein